MTNRAVLCSLMLLLVASCGVPTEPTGTSTSAQMCSDCDPGGGGGAEIFSQCGSPVPFDQACPAGYLLISSETDCACPYVYGPGGGPACGPDNRVYCALCGDGHCTPPTYADYPGETAANCPADCH